LNMAKSNDPLAKSLSAVVLAAGEGTRMKSGTPKPLHTLCGRAMVLHVLDALAELEFEKVVVVVGHGAEQVTKTLYDQAPSDLSIEFVEQMTQRGTGDAVGTALTALADPIDETQDGDIVVLPGDTPLLRAPTLAALVRSHRAAGGAATLLTAKIADPTGYGRIIRDKNSNVIRVVEHMDANDSERNIQEVCTSIYVFRHSVLGPALRKLIPINSQGEYYLTDVIGVLSQAGYQINSMTVADPMEAAGVNDRAQLAIAEAELRDRINERWMRKGVSMTNPEATYIDATVKLAEDVTILPGCMLKGTTVIDSGCVIGPNTTLVDCVVSKNCVIEYSKAIQAEIGEGAKIAPFCIINSGVRIEPQSAVGPFVNVKEP
jgi:bifunctional UDP-N-acetylglucosamine pyrophosphorylase/glucosamine-1-phosphate N-acetyltransferase